MFVNNRFLSCLSLQYPRATEERVPLSTALNRTSSAISSGVVVVDTNLETSSPDAYIPPPLPIPFDVAIRVPQNPENGEEAACVDIREVSVETANTEPAQETVDGITLGVPATTCPCKETESKLQTEIDLESTEDIDPKKPSKDVFVPIEEEEDCPICLEGNVFLPSQSLYMNVNGLYIVSLLLIQNMIWITRNF